MSEDRKYYSIHDTVHFSITDKTSYFNQMFDTFYVHYENFENNKKSEKCDFTIEIGKFKPNLTDTYVVGDGKYYFRENYLYIAGESHKGAYWRFEIEGLNNANTVVRIDCNNLGRMFITGNVIDFLIHLKLMEKNYPIIHASAVTKNNKILVFSSRGGGGKTTVALELASRGFNFVADNYVMIHQGTVIAFPTSLSIFSYNLSPIIIKNLMFKEKVSLVLKKVLYKGTLGYAKIFTKINPQRVFHDSISISKLHAGFLLLPHSNTSGDQISVEEIDMKEFIEKVSINQMLEFPFFSRYIDEYSYLFPKSCLSQHWETYKETLTSNFSKNSSYYKLFVPQQYNPAVLHKILELTDSVHKKL